MLRTWAAQLARRRGAKRAMVASLKKHVYNRCLPDCRLTRVPQGRGSDDAVVRTVAEKIEHAYEMGASGLHLNQHHVGSQSR